MTEAVEIDSDRRVKDLRHTLTNVVLRRPGFTFRWGRAIIPASRPRTQKKEKKEYACGKDRPSVDRAITAFYSDPPAEGAARYYCIPHLPHEGIHYGPAAGVDNIPQRAVHMSQRLENRSSSTSQGRKAAGRWCSALIPERIAVVVIDGGARVRQPRPLAGAL